ncbi:MAG: NAD-dependent epimerase/dehydratase family protein [Planctomycetes bacterium]|nr:NAD-dependent epimerase/dehydratase family protein [Planctomycetota bacterium]MBI3835213.1 NAD-dependent epimerase/dehydratase family protein [Planctomycetota bacterium]
MNVLITGSSGQIGTNLALAMMARGDRVIGVDCRRNSWTDKIETVQADLVTCGVDRLPKPDGLNLVVHFAANAKVFDLVTDPQRAMDNISSLFTVLNYCRIHRLPIIFASSREVYGDIHRHITHETSADFVVAESPYSASKIAGEALIYSFAQCYELPFLVFRFSNVYGRYDCDIERMERVIPLFIDRIARDQPIVVFGREKVLDFTYVDDAVAGVLLGADALVSGRVMRETINLACGQGNSLVDVVNIIALALGKKPQVRYEPSRVGEVTRYVADITKARTLLSYEPRTPLSEGLVKAVEWTKSFRKL